ncbi:MAG: hypothetical protein ACOCX3_00285 [Chloroflexota bacterium]
MATTSRRNRLAQSHEPQPRRWLITPLFAGTLIGLALMTLLLPGGYDGWLYYLQPWFPETTAPGTVHLLLSPLTLLPPDPDPFRWTALVLLSLVVVRWAAWVWDVPWWITIYSVPMLWNLWLGQIELMAVAGAAIGWLVIQRRLPVAWLGLAGLLLVIKVQVGWGLALLYVWWLWRDRGWHALITPAIVAVDLILVTLVIYPGWTAHWLASLEQLGPQDLYFNSAIFPLGLVAWAFALLPVKMGRLRRARLIAAATLLGSPYFANYHCTTLMSMQNRPLMLVVSWLTVVPLLLFVGERYTWAQSFAWLIPAALIALELWGVYQNRKRRVEHPPNRVIVND